ncbi:CoA transferase [Microbacterium stercoris]|uniref:CoA transferase n=1 Tax=Microbacterium stercoris TaxID=2820289 RepID=A0A939QP42_9MICO|nr:CoA transferase [Microbacterium stercoris]MBO3662961.1 CoA transferase [Microbacterium stercoris]
MPFARAAAHALGIPPEQLERVEATAPAWSSHLPVAELAVDSAAVASLAIDLTAEARGSVSSEPVRIDGARVAASFASDRVLRVDGKKPDVWSPLSGFWRTADGWVRTHGNYPHHAERLRRLLGTDDIARGAAGWAAIDLEQAAIERGAIVAAVRTEEEWRAHPQAQAVADQPLITLTSAGEASARSWTSDATPLGGIRVLDLTRVIAGPVATRDLAHAGADVLRIDSPALPEFAWQHLDTGHGKRSALLDLAADREAFEALLAQSDVLVTGYRPDALTRFGLDAGDLADRHPGLVTARLSAWGSEGPWAHRRGFDSIVQATAGIAMRESRDDETPGALPVQALDHAAGHLLAAAVATALVRQRRDGGSPHVEIALARVAQELLAAPAVTRTEHPEPDLPSHVTQVAGGPSLTHAPPILAFAGAPDRFAPPRPWGGDAATWDA